MKIQKHTSELLEDFQSKLINRRSDLYETIHRFQAQSNDQEKILYESTLDEINRVDKILKSIKKL